MYQFKVEFFLCVITTDKRAPRYFSSWTKLFRETGSTFYSSLLTNCLKPISGPLSLSTAQTTAVFFKAASRVLYQFISLLAGVLSGRRRLFFSEVFSSKVSNCPTSYTFKLATKLKVEQDSCRLASAQSDRHVVPDIIFMRKEIISTISIEKLKRQESQCGQRFSPATLVLVAYPFTFNCFFFL